MHKGRESYAFPPLVHGKIYLTMKKTHNYKLRGFTLVEMLVVLAIAVILMSILFASFQQSREKSRDDVRASDLAQIQLALRLYAEQNSSYPKDIDGFTGADGLISRDNPLNLISNEVDQYLGSIPEDPIHDGTDFYYYYDANAECNGVKKVVLFANTMETEKYKNSSDCSSWNGEYGVGNADSYNVIIDDAHPDD